MLKQTTAFALILLASPAFLGAQESRNASEDSNLKRLAGSWQGEGTMHSMSVTVRVTSEWALQNRFLRSSYDAKSSDGKWKYTADGYMRPLGNGKYQSVWISSDGHVSQNELRYRVDRFTMTYQSQGVKFRLDKVVTARGYRDETFQKDGEKWRSIGVIRYRKVKGKTIDDIADRVKKGWEDFTDKLRKRIEGKNRGKVLVERVNKRMVEKIERGQVKTDDEMEIATLSCILDTMKDMGIRKDDRMAPEEKEAFKKGLDRKKAEWKALIRKRWGK